MTSPFTLRLTAPLLLAALLVVGVGCDFTRVDEGAEVPLQAHLDALATASTPDAAERAIRGALNKVGARTSWQADVTDENLAFAAFAVTDAEIERLAEQQAAFVSGQSAGTPLNVMHDAVVLANEEAREIVRNMDVGVTPVTRGPIQVSATEAAAILRAEAATALRTPEMPSSSLALMITASGSEIMSAEGTLSEGHTLSPVQRLLFAVWLHHNGPFMYPFLSEGDARTARAASGDDCDACCGGTGKFTDITFQYLGDTSADVEVVLTQPASQINGFVPYPEATVQPGEIFYVSATGRTNASGGFVGTLGNEIEIFVDGTEIDYSPFGDPDNPDANTGSIHTSCSEKVFPGDRYGDFLVVAVATQSNGLCSDLETCTSACESQRNTCLVAANGDQGLIDKCEATFRQCDQNCHDQGGIGL